MYGLLPGVIEKDLILDGYLGTYSNAQSNEITFFEENSVLVLRFQLSYFSVEPIGKT
jgi:hypothetical protein